MADKKPNSKRKLEEFVSFFFDNLISRTIPVLREGPQRNVSRTVKKRKKK